MSLLSQADVLVGNRDAQLGLQALDLFFNRDWRLYVRSTLPVPGGNEADRNGETPTVPGNLPSSAISALVDPYGGVLNLTTGTFTQIPIHNSDPSQGLFIDARFGLKLVNLPDQSDDAPSLLNTGVSPFYTGAVLLKVRRNVFPSADGQDAAGGFEFGIGGVINAAADTNASRAFATGLLDKATGAIRCDLALSLRSVAAITVSWTPWSSNDTFGKRFVVGLKLLNQNPVVD